jgi:hypothetical protein
MKKHWQDRQSEILPDHLGNSQCVVRAAAIEDDDAVILNWLRTCVVNPVDRSQGAFASRCAR